MHRRTVGSNMMRRKELGVFSRREAKNFAKQWGIKVFDSEKGALVCNIEKMNNENLTQKSLNIYLK